MAEDVTSTQHETYLRIHESEDFGLLRSRFRRFALAGTISFMAWYLLYVLMSSFAVDFMSTKIVGNVNIALVFGLLQFASTFLIAALYSRYASSQLDPLGDRLREGYDREVSR